MDAIPTQWGEPRQHSRIDLASAAAHFFDGVPKIATVEQDDRCGDEVEGSRAGLLVLQATVATATEPMEGDRSRQDVARLALVQLGGDRAASDRQGTRLNSRPSCASRMPSSA